MKRLLKTFSVLLAGLSMTGCGAPEPGIQVDINHDCSETSCDVLVQITNPGKDSFDVEYEFAAYDRDSALLAELDESVHVPAHRSWSHRYVIPVTSKPMMITAGSGSTRIRS